MKEQHENEQYFFNQKTIEALAAIAQNFEKVCCLCAPTVGNYLTQQNQSCTILDIDRRFEDIEGFEYFDITQAKWTDKQYDLIICDPPFFNVSLRQLLKAIRVLSNYNPKQKLLICYLERRSRTFMEVFKEFEMKQLDFYAGYQTVKPIEKNRIVFFGNIE